MPATIVANENSSATLNNNAIMVTDAEASGASEQVSLSVSSGTLTLSGTTGLTFNGRPTTKFLDDRDRHARRRQHLPSTVWCIRRRRNFFGSDTLNGNVAPIWAIPPAGATAAALTVNQVATHFVVQRARQRDGRKPFNISVTAEDGGNNTVTGL